MNEPKPLVVGQRLWSSITHVPIWIHEVHGQYAFSRRNDPIHTHWSFPVLGNGRGEYLCLGVTFITDEHYVLVRQHMAMRPALIEVNRRLASADPDMVASVCALLGVKMPEHIPSAEEVLVEPVHSRWVHIA